MRALRLPIAGLAAALLARTHAVAGERLTPARKLFPYLDLYLGLPPAQRDVFTMSYQVRENGGPPRAVRIAFVSGGGRTPAPLDEAGRLERLPTLEEWRGQAAVEAPAGTRLSVNMRLGCTGVPGREPSVERLARCVAQYRAALGRAGPFSLLAPRLDRVVLREAGGGEVVTAEGARRPLPLQGGHPVFEPAAWRGARAMVLERAPTELSLAGPPKGR